MNGLLKRVGLAYTEVEGLWAMVRTWRRRQRNGGQAAEWQSAADGGVRKS